MNTAKSGKTKTAAKSVRSAKKSAKTAKIPAGQTLVVVESPAKAKTIEKYLGKNYLVRASMGHLRDLPKSQFGIDVEHDFAPKYINIRGKGDLIKELKKAAKTPRISISHPIRTAKVRRSPGIWRTFWVSMRRGIAGLFLMR